MQIILNNFEPFEVKNIVQSTNYIQGNNRASLVLTFSNEKSLDELNAIFSEMDNLKTIKVVQSEGDEIIFNNYTLLSEIRTQLVEIFPTIEEQEEGITSRFEKQTFVTLAKLTYQEEQLAILTEVVEAIVLEMLSQEG